LKGKVCCYANKIVKTRNDYCRKPMYRFLKSDLNTNDK
jgi:hypothetical protein